MSNKDTSDMNHGNVVNKIIVATKERMAKLLWLLVSVLKALVEGIFRVLTHIDNDILSAFLDFFLQDLAANISAGEFTGLTGEDRFLFLTGLVLIRSIIHGFCHRPDQENDDEKL